MTTTVAGSAASVVASQDVYSITAVSPTAGVRTSGIQGPEGIPGQPGPAGSTTIPLTAAQVISGHKALLGTAMYASQDNLAHAGKVIGISANAAAIGEVVNVQASGELNGLSGLTIGQPIYLGVNGALTQTIPTAGIIQQLGVAVKTDTMIIDIQIPLILE